MSIKRGDIFWAHLDPVKGSEQGGRRPVLIIQNDIGNELASTVIIAPLTSKSFSREFPTNVNVPKNTAGLKSDSTVLFHQIRVLDKSRLESRIGSFPLPYIQKVNRAIKISLGLD